MSNIIKEASRLVFLIDDIICLSELDEGAEMPRGDVSLKVRSEEVCATKADAAKLKDVSLKETGDDGVIHGVRRLLCEIVYDLCDNAIKCNNTGGCVKVTVEQMYGKVLLSVQDTALASLLSIRIRCLNASTVSARAIPSSPAAPALAFPSSSMPCSIIMAKSR